LNEKICIFNFPDFIADTIVTMSLEEIYEFWKNHKKIVVKGLTGFGGDSVILIENWEKDREKLQTLSQSGKRFLMAQKFLENIYLGDKRITMVDGKVLGVFSRVPAENTFIAYTGAGATVHLAELTEREELISKEEALRKKFRAE
jgi:glutathione synthase